jgi:hypothetical protein
MYYSRATTSLPRGTHLPTGRSMKNGTWFPTRCSSDVRRRQRGAMRAVCLDHRPISLFPAPAKRPCFQSIRGRKRRTRSAGDLESTPDFAAPSGSRAVIRFGPDEDRKGCHSSPLTKCRRLMGNTTYCTNVELCSPTYCGTEHDGRFCQRADSHAERTDRGSGGSGGASRAGCR